MRSRGDPDASYEYEAPSTSKRPCVTRLTFPFKAHGVTLGLRPLLGWCHRFRLRVWVNRPYNYHASWRSSPSDGHVKFEVSSELPARLREWYSHVQ